MFGELNGRLEKESNPCAVFYHNLKINLIKTLNTIVKHYLFVHPDQRSLLFKSELTRRALARVDRQRRSARARVERSGKPSTSSTSTT